MGKGKTSDVQAAQEHISRPLATLKDPSSFGPPPKNVNYHGGAALPNEITPHRSGLGAPLTQTQISGASRTVQSPPAQEEEEPAKPPPPSLPYRADRTGLRTDNLPPPPVHRDLNKPTATPPPVLSTRASAPVSQPRLPPRLPSRQNTMSPPVNEPPPPSYDAVASKPVPSPTPSPSPYINQSAVGRLGKAGVSVPGFGIGSQTETNPWQTEPSKAQASGSNQLSELQSRFARMNSQETSTTSAPTTPVQNPTQNSMPSWKQSQSAFQTAQNLRTNPQNVTLADAHSAAQTAGQAQRSANAFREKHADQIAAAQTKAKAWDQKYKVTSKINKFLDDHSEPANQQQQSNGLAGQTSQQPQNQFGQAIPQVQSPAPVVPTYTAPPQIPQHPTTSVQHTPQSPAPTELSASIARKPPPPPAPRKPANLQAPPPVPMGTKPSFG